MAFFLPFFRPFWVGMQALPPSASNYGIDKINATPRPPARPFGGAEIAGVWAMVWAVHEYYGAVCRVVAYRTMETVREGKKGLNGLSRR